MGLFSSSEETSVGTSISRVLEDKAVPNSSKTGVIKSIFKNGNMMDYLIAELSDSVGIRAERMYAYGGSKYTYGLPSGELYSATKGRNLVEPILETLTGAPVDLEYSRYGQPNALHIGWQRLQEQYGYQSSTNEIKTLSTQKGTPVYLDNMVVVQPYGKAGTLSPKELEQWGPAPNSGYTPERIRYSQQVADLIIPWFTWADPAASEPHIRVDYVWAAPNNNPWYSQEILRDSLIIPISGFNKAADYFHVRYSQNGESKFWMYEIGTGTYPTLDSIYNVPSDVVGEYFPFAYFRYAKTSMASDTSSEAYKTSKKLVNYLGIDYADLIESIHENPDIDDVEQAMLMMMVPANTQNSLEQRYLFEYFDNLYYAQENKFATPTNALINSIFHQDDDIATNVAVIQDARFKMALSNGGIFRRQIVGSIGPKGSYTSSFEQRTESYEYTDGNNGEAQYGQYIVPVHIYRKQISEAVYEELRVQYLRMTYYVYGNHSTLGDGTSEILMVPIDRTVTENFPIPAKEELYSRSLHYVFNSRVVTEVAWYQQGWFSAVMIVVAIVVTVITYGAAWQAMAAAVTAGSISLASALLSIAIGALKFVAVGAAAKLIAQAAGAEVAIVIALVAAAYGAYSAYTAGGLANAPWASELLSASNSLIKAAGTTIQAKIEGLQDEAEAFGLAAQEQLKLLDAANDLLENDTVLSPLYIIGESPDDYYRRTMYAGNAGLIAVTGISSYVDRALRLPTLSDTLGENFNGW